MNKQELIDKLASLVGSIEDFKGISTFHDGKYAGLEHALELIQQLDEPQKPVVPEFVADWFEEHKRNLDYSIWEYIREWDQQDRFSDFHQWFDKEPNNPIEILIRMKDGYEVEKEPLWAIKNADGNYLTKCALWGKDGVNYSFECNPSHRLLFTDKATADAAALLVNGTVEEVVER